MSFANPAPENNNNSTNQENTPGTGDTTIITERIINAFTQNRGWVSFVAILGLIVAILSLIQALFQSDVIGVIVGIVGLISAIFLFTASRSMQRAYTSRSLDEAKDSLSNLGKYFMLNILLLLSGFALILFLLIPAALIAFIHTAQ